MVIAKVDADAGPNKPLGSRFGVSGFPTIKYFPKGSTEAQDYSLGREVENFVTFLNEKAGTKRLAKGGLMSDVGRLSQLDALVKDLVSGAKKTISAELEEAKKAVSDAEKSFADFYAVVAKKYEKEGKPFVEKQLKRISGMLESQHITAEKKDDFQIKHNILSSFGQTEE